MITFHYRSKLPTKLKWTANIEFHKTKKNNIVCNTYLYKAYFKNTKKIISDCTIISDVLHESFPSLDASLTELEIYETLENDGYFVTVICGF